MRESESEHILRTYGGFRTVPRIGLLTAMAIGAAMVLTNSCGIVTGWYMHNAYWRSSQVDYTLARALDHMARCKGETRGDQIRTIENHAAMPLRQFKFDEKLAALDYVFDQIEILRCFVPAPDTDISTATIRLP